MLPSGFDAWKAAGYGERRSDPKYAGLCGACGHDFFGKEIIAWQCAKCGVIGCEDCPTLRIINGKKFCSACAERESNVTNES